MKIIIILMIIIIMPSSRGRRRFDPLFDDDAGFSSINLPISH